MVSRSSPSFVKFQKEEIEQSIPSRFGQEVRQFPNHVAVRTRTEEITYRELDRLSNRVAHSLLKRAGAKEEPIALFFDAGVPMIAAILGVLKAGRFFLPLDPTSPSAHNAAIFDCSRAACVLTDTRNHAGAAHLARSASRVIQVDALDPDAPETPVEDSATADSPAYVLYTSGSTGHPKGVLHNHRNVLHAIYQHTNSLCISSEDRISLLASYGRIAGMTCLWRALLNGATLCVFNLRAEGWGELVRWLIAEGITIYQSVPTLYRHWAKRLTDSQKFPRLRIIHLGGEPVKVQDVNLFQKHFSADCLLLHNLGSTEVSTYRQYFLTKDTPFSGNLVPVGYPIEDKTVILVDEAGREVGANEIGEIVVKSRYLAVEYWLEPELSRAAFRPDPQGGQERLFATGDLGRMRPDGCLEHLGRKDRQVKIRGIRIEPAEVEAVLEQEPSVRQALVVAREDSGGYNQLIGYILATPGKEPSGAVLRTHLRELLPEHMVPAVFITLDEFPLTAGGKVDHRALPAPDLTGIPHSEAPFVAPRSYVEKTVARIWEEVLETSGVGLHDRFLDLGGNSLKAIQVISRLQETLDGIFPLESLFSTATLEQQAAAVEEHRTAAQKEGAEFIARLEAMSDEEAEWELEALNQKREETKRKKSQWQTEGMSKAFLDIRSAIPGSDLQIEVMLKIIREWYPKPKTAIDLGCGDGFLGRTLLEHFPDCRVWFVDFSDPMLEAARNRLQGSARATVIKADFATPAWAAPLAGCGEFDLVVSGLAIHHLTDPGKKQLYAEVYQLLSAGGVFLNLDQVASATEPVAAVYYEYIIDQLYAFQRRSDPDKSRQAVADAYYSSPARKENILALAEIQCAWLSQIGYQDVDCFFKVFEHALIGGRKKAVP